MTTYFVTNEKLEVKLRNGEKAYVVGLYNGGDYLIGYHLSGPFILWNRDGSAFPNKGEKDIVDLWIEPPVVGSVWADSAGTYEIIFIYDNDIAFLKVHDQSGEFSHYLHTPVTSIPQRFTFVSK